jgi:hypothetical protein
MLKIKISMENNFNEQKNTYFKVGMLKICRSMEVVLSTGETSFGGNSKTWGVLEKWGLELTVNDWNTGAKKKKGSNVICGPANRLFLAEQDFTAEKFGRRKIISNSLVRVHAGLQC